MGTFQFFTKVHIINLQARDPCCFVLKPLTESRCVNLHVARVRPRYSLLVTRFVALNCSRKNLWATSLSWNNLCSLASVIPGEIYHLSTQGDAEHDSFRIALYYFLCILRRDVCLCNREMECYCLSCPSQDFGTRHTRQEFRIFMIKKRSAIVSAILHLKLLN